MSNVKQKQLDTIEANPDNFTRLIEEDDIKLITLSLTTDSIKSEEITKTGVSAGDTITLMTNEYIEINDNPVVFMPDPSKDGDEYLAYVGENQPGGASSFDITIDSNLSISSDEITFIVRYTALENKSITFGRNA